MDVALNEILKNLPVETQIFPGHEYTVANLKFACHVEPGNEKAAQKLEWAQRQIEQGGFTVPSTVAEEKATNPFMRVRESEEIQKSIGTCDAVVGMAKLREMKNKF